LAPKAAATSTASTAAHGLHDILAQHQVRDIRAGNHDTLISRETSRMTQIEESFDLLIHSADGLDLSVLVDGAGHRERLAQRDTGDGRKKRIELCQRSAVPLDASVGLLEDETRRQGKWQLRRIALSQESRENEDTLRVQRPGELYLALDVNDLTRPEPHARGDAAGTTESEVSELKHGQAVDLPDRNALRADL
jgi:hypothetical protein